MSAYETMWRVDGNGKPISVKRTETIQVSTVHFNVVLDEIPHAFYGVEIEDQEGNTYHVVESEDNITGQGCYVDYNNGIITFAPEHGGKIMTFTYNGRGYKKVYSSRDGCPSDRKINRREAGPERSGLAISVLFGRQCSGIKHCLGFRLLGSCPKP